MSEKYYDYEKVVCIRRSLNYIRYLLSVCVGLLIISVTCYQYVKDKLYQLDHKQASSKAITRYLTLGRSQQL